MTASAELETGRRAWAARAWADAAEALAAADRRRPLDPEDLELLATARFMVGRDEGYYATLERAHDGHLGAGATRPAARCAFWLGMTLLMRGEMGRGGGWLGRAHRLLEHDGDCAERAYLLLPEVYRREAEGDIEGAVATAAAAAEAGRRFGDADLYALATHVMGGFQVARGRVSEGLGLLDEAMLALAQREVSPLPTGIVYCGAIGGCQAAFDPRRAAEWTAALHAWCAAQPDMIAFTGDCHVHRAEIMELRGAWQEALHELEWAARRAERAANRRVVASSAYHRGEILRRQGDLAGAEDAFREAARGGHEPQPGRALLRLAQGETGAAAASIRRMLEETSAPVRRVALLPACVDIMVAAGDLDSARAACAELEAIAAERPSEMLGALADHARGTVELAGGDARGALPPLRRALAAWHDLDAPYQAARARMLVARACRALGDEDSAELELEGAREALAALGAAAEAGPAPEPHGLTARELQVLRLVAGGATNRAIAAELVLSERTIDRHVSNIFAKLRVSSRAGATAYAYEHRLL